MDIKLTPACDSPAAVNRLFAEYVAYMAGNEPLIKKYLAMQHYDEEKRDLEKKYGLPAGRLYLAYAGAKLAGCGGLRQMDAETCELKRLFVLPVFRRQHIGEKIVSRLISDARDIGYKYMLLDTLGFMREAIALYKKLGFYEIPRYNDTPIDDTVFMKCDL